MTPGTSAASSEKSTHRLNTARYNGADVTRRVEDGCFGHSGANSLSQGHRNGSVLGRCHPRGLSCSGPVAGAGHAFTSGVGWRRYSQRLERFWR